VIARDGALLGVRRLLSVIPTDGALLSVRRSLGVIPTDGALLDCSEPNENSAAAPPIRSQPHRRLIA
jgi:hypothetical protein